MPNVTERGQSVEPAPKPLFEVCSDCQGRYRPVAPLCLNCGGKGFVATPLTDRFVAELVEGQAAVKTEHAALLLIAQEYIDLCEHGEVSYLSDEALHGLYARLTSVVETARRGGRLPTPRGQ